MAAGLIVLLMVIFIPQFWTQYIFKRYSTPVEQLPGTGGELAQHLINKFELSDVKVEQLETDDNHYDPEQKTIRLSPQVYTEKSLTSVVIAAHEVGHAIQHQSAYRPLYLRWRMARVVAISEKIAAMMLVAFPFAAILTKLPLIGGLMLFCGIMILLLPVVFHLITLPVELDASFNRALPILEHGQYLPESAMPIARKILMAAAFTYIAASLASVLNFYRWLTFLRR
ncbi:MAG: zinc metallopeptidase [Gammaproteobacteria bacterium]|nr:zinc metallopeptidase [Gammaproteobacteria bacterium]